MVDEESSKRNGFRASQLPTTMRASALELVRELDTDGDGFIDDHEFVAAVDALRSVRSRNARLYKIVLLLSCATVLLVGGMFGVSIAAARLAKDTMISSDGTLQNKRSLSIVKTKEATVWSSETEIIEMTPQQLANLKTFTLLDGKIKFDIHGYARTPDDGKVILLVSGGTVTWDNKGITAATGNARYMLDVAFGVTGMQEIESHGRNLQIEDPHDRPHCPERRMLSIGNIYRNLNCVAGSGPSSSESSESSDSSDSSESVDSTDIAHSPTREFPAFQSLVSDRKCKRNFGRAGPSIFEC